MALIRIEKQAIKTLWLCRVLKFGHRIRRLLGDWPTGRKTVTWRIGMLTLFIYVYLQILFSLIILAMDFKTVIDKHNTTTNKTKNYWGWLIMEKFEYNFTAIISKLHACWVGMKLPSFSFVIVMGYHQQLIWKLTFLFCCLV